MAHVGTLRRVKRGQQYAGETELAIMACPTCGVLYAIPEVMRAEAYRLGEHKIEWCCPNAHNVGYSCPSEQRRAEREAREARERAAYEQAQREQAQASALAQERAASRARNERDKDRRRVAHGVCPCCKRTFKALGRHMASQHPDYAEPWGMSDVTEAVRR